MRVNQHQPAAMSLHAWTSKLNPPPLHQMAVWTVPRIQGGASCYVRLRLSMPEEDKHKVRQEVGPIRCVGARFSAARLVALLSFLFYLISVPFFFALQPLL